MSNRLSIHRANPALARLSEGGACCSTVAQMEGHSH